MIPGILPSSRVRCSAFRMRTPLSSSRCFSCPRQGRGEFVIAVHVSENRGVVLLPERHFIRFVAKVAHQVAAFHQVLVVRHEEPPFPAAEVLKVVQAERPRIPHRPAHSALVHRPVRLAGVLDDEEIVFLRDGENGIHIGGTSLNVDGNDRLRAFGHGGLDLRRVYCVCPRHDVGKHRYRQLMQNAGCGGKKRVGGDDHFIPRSYAESGEPPCAAQRFHFRS